MTEQEIQKLKDLIREQGKERLAAAWEKAMDEVCGVDRSACTEAEAGDGVRYYRSYDPRAIYRINADSSTDLWMDDDDEWQPSEVTADEILRQARENPDTDHEITPAHAARVMRGESIEDVLGGVQYFQKSASGKVYAIAPNGGGFRFDGGSVGWFPAGYCANTIRSFSPIPRDLALSRTGGVPAPGDEQEQEWPKWYAWARSDANGIWRMDDEENGEYFSRYGGSEKSIRTAPSLESFGHPRITATDAEAIMAGWRDEQPVVAKSATPAQPDPVAAVEGAIASMSIMRSAATKVSRFSRVNILDAREVASELETISNALQSALPAIRKLSGELAIRKQQVSESLDELIRVEAGRKQALAERDEARTQLEAAENKAAEWGERCEALESDRDRLREQLEQTRNHLHDAEEAAFQKGNACDELQSALTAARREVEAKDSLIATERGLLQQVADGVSWGRIGHETYDRIIAHLRDAPAAEADAQLNADFDATANDGLEGEVPYGEGEPNWQALANERLRLAQDAAGMINSLLSASIGTPGIHQRALKVRDRIKNHTHRLTPPQAEQQVRWYAAIDAVWVVNGESLKAVLADGTVRGGGDIESLKKTAANPNMPVVYELDSFDAALAHIGPNDKARLALWRESGEPLPVWVKHHNETPEVQRVTASLVEYYAAADAKPFDTGARVGTYMVRIRRGTVSILTSQEAQAVIGGGE